MLNIFKRFRKPEQVRFRTVHVSANVWRSTPALVATAKRVLESADFLAILDCVEDESPARRYLLPGASVEDRALHQARIEGWNMFREVAMSLTIAPSERKLPDETFEPQPTDE